MRIERLHFKDFEAGAITVARKPNLPGGRRKEEAPPPPPAPTFSEEQLKAAERESYKKGFLEGTEEGRKQAESEQAEVDRQLTQQVERYVTTITPLLADYRKMALQLRQDLPKVALAISRKIAGDALEANAQAAVSEMALRCVEMMIGEPKLAVTVHSSLAATLEGKLKALAVRLNAATDFLVIGDEQLPVADCRIEWKYGAMERHTGKLWQEIERVVESMIASGQRDTQTQIAALQEQLPPTDTNQKE